MGNPKRRRFFSIALCLLCPVFFSCAGSEGDEADSGVWHDPATGLSWQEPPLSDKRPWPDAAAYCEALSLDGRDDWRLPSIDELRGLVRGCDATATGGACAVDQSCLRASCRGDACEGCGEFDGPGIGGCHRDPELTGDCMFYWSSTAAADRSGDAWCVGFGGAHVSLFPKAESDIGSTRCVRR